jgi:hypothetical protein
MATLIKQATKARLQEAVHDMSILHDDGMHPTQALAKIAEEFDLSPEQIRLAGRTFNTAQTNTHRQENESLLDKLSSCPLADVEAVARSKEPVTTKTASVKTASIYDTDIDKRIFRDLSGKLKLATFQLESLRKKTAAAPIEPLPPLPKLASDRDYLQRQQTNCRVTSNGLKVTFEKQAGELRTLVKRLDKDQQVTLKLAAVQRFGKEIEPYLYGIIDSDIRTPVKIATVVELSNPLIKKIAQLHQTGKDLIRTLKTFQKVSNCLNIIDSMRGQHLKKTSAIAPLVQKYAASGGGGAGSSSSGTGSSSGGGGFFDDWRNAAAKYKKQREGQAKETDSPWLANPVGTTLQKSKALWDVISNPLPSQESGYAMTLPTPHQQFGLDTPSQQFKLDKIRVRSMLSDFVNNDEVISNFSHDDVMTAFNELSETSPEAMKKPAIARAMLREYLAKGALGTYDLSPLMQYEKQFLDTKDTETKGDLTRSQWFDSPSGRYMKRPKTPPKEQSSQRQQSEKKPTHKP